jgi:hypothetical protein
VKKKKLFLEHAKSNLLVLVWFILFNSCKTDIPDPTTALPQDYAAFLSLKACNNCEIFKESKLQSSYARILMCDIAHPQSGKTFYVNIDQTRKIVKLRSVRDVQEPFIFYDPSHSGSLGLEINSAYEQARCTCSGNRFTLSAAFCYELDKSPENFSKLIIAGTCTLCQKQKILFEND